MRRFFPRDVKLILTIAAVLLMAMLAACGWQRLDSMQRLRETTQLAGEEFRLLAAVGQSLNDTEATELAYLRNGAGADLTAYRQAARRTDLLTDRLQRRATIDAKSGALLAGLMRLVDRRQDTLVQEVSLRITGSPAAALVARHSMRDLPLGSVLSDRLASAARALDLRRRASLDAETRRLRTVRWLAAAVTLLGVLCVLSLFHLLWSAWRRLARAETEQRRMALQLRGSLDSLSQGVAVFSDEGHLLNWNARLRQMLDLPPALLARGLAYTALERHLASGGVSFLEPLHAIRADSPGCDDRPMVYERDVRRNAASAETRIEIRRTLMPQGGFVLTLTDMTERVQAERMLGEAQKMQALGQLTGGIAHDFNNMLTVILGNLDVSEVRKTASAADLMPILAMRMRRAAQAAESGAALTRQLLAFARKQPLAPAALDLGSSLPQLVPLLHHTLGENIGIDFATDPDLWPAMADAGQLESAVLNLAFNARDAMPGGGRLAIEAGNVCFDHRGPTPHPELAAGEYVRISVTDTGHGMSRDVMARAFEPFFTTKEEGRGTGLGLATVFSFARQSGGLAMIQSEPGQGTRIMLYLPRASTQAIGVPAGRLVPAGGENQTIRSAGFNAPHILLVEDDQSVREVASEMLRELGYRVSEAPDAEAALRGLDPQQGSLDLLLTDLKLPGALDGRALAARVRQIQPAARILYMSGQLEETSLPGGGAEEASDCLGKPFRRAQLASKVGALVGPVTQGRAA